MASGNKKVETRMLAGALVAAVGLLVLLEIRHQELANRYETIDAAHSPDVDAAAAPNGDRSSAFELSRGGNSGSSLGIPPTGRQR